MKYGNTSSERILSVVRMPTNNLVDKAGRRGTPSGWEDQNPSPPISTRKSAK
jgi:hypothetical protein